MAELADALDLGSSAARRAGSTPASRSAPSSNKRDHLIIEGSSQTVTVAIDAHGHSLYADAAEQARASLPALMAELDADRLR